MKKMRVSALYIEEMPDFKQNDGLRVLYWRNDRSWKEMRVSARYTDEMTDFENNEGLHAL